MVKNVVLIFFLFYLDNSSKTSFPFTINFFQISRVFGEIELSYSIIKSLQFFFCFGRIGFFKFCSQ